MYKAVTLSWIDRVTNKLVCDLCVNMRFWTLHISIRCEETNALQRIEFCTRMMFTAVIYRQQIRRSMIVSEQSFQNLGTLVSTWNKVSTNNPIYYFQELKYNTSSCHRNSFFSDCNDSLRLKICICNKWNFKISKFAQVYFFRNGFQ